jgi:hypothetical protein
MGCGTCLTGTIRASRRQDIADIMEKRPAKCQPDLCEQLDKNAALFDTLKKLTKAGDGRHDLADTLVSGFLACIGKDVLPDRLHLSHAEAKARKPARETHEAASQAIVFRSRRSRRAWQGREQGIDLVFGTLLAEERQNHPHRFFCDPRFDTSLSGNAGDQIIHLKPRGCSRIART